MSRPAVRLALFAVLLAAVGGGAFAIGTALDDSDKSVVTASHGDTSAGAQEHGADVHETAPAATSDHGAATHGAAQDGAGEAVLPGLASEQDGYRVQLRTPGVRTRGRHPLVLRIVDAGGKVVRDFDVAHTKLLHLIVVRRDLQHFQHLHPAMGRDGTFRTDLTLRAAGAYRLFADFTIAGVQRTLGVDLIASGAYSPVALPAPARTVRDDHGYAVRLERAGDAFTFSVSNEHGHPVDDALQPYLGARGHLVTLREGDLAYLHTHPHGDGLGFESALPSAGRYRLWVQFRVAGKVHTAAFTHLESR